MNLLTDPQIKSQGLNPRRIRRHQRRILQALLRKINIDITIKEACTLENKGIIDWKTAHQIFQPSTLSSQQWQAKHLITCIPAAGAASRFFVELNRFAMQWENTPEKEIAANLHNFSKEFPFLQNLLQHITESSEVATPNLENISRAYLFSKKILETYATLPKLYAPATKEKDSFLDLKIQEQQHLLPCLGNCLIVPYGLKEEIKGKLYQRDPKKNLRWYVLEQDIKLSTIRFLQTGEPFLDEEGKYSIVSAGHGELLHLFGDIADHFTQAQCLHIRNIDNIIGIKKEQKEQIQVPSNLFYELRQILEFLRKKIPTLNFEKDISFFDENLFQKLSLFAKLLHKSPEDFFTKNTLSQQNLYGMLAQLFHWPALDPQLSVGQIWKTLLEHCERPLSVFSVVQKEKNDVGGGPVFAAMTDDSHIKFCMEMPHANPQDTQEFFSEKGKTTHFNPVIVFFELRTHTDNTTKKGKKVNFAQLFDERFWLLSKREHKNTSVCYHETVLYELIGNSTTTNLVFVEVPRALFNPHKSYLNCLTKDRKAYGFDENPATKC